MNEVKVTIKEDSFLHFTTKQRAKEVLDSGKLLMNPPYKKFGIDAITAVSVNHGKYVPRVQTTHIGDDEEIIAIWFTTDTKPSYGYIEEVIWHEDVNLINAKIITKEQAVKMLNSNDDVEDLYLIYEMSDFTFGYYIQGKI